MRITALDFHGLRSALPQPARFAWGEASARNVGLVRIELDGGREGWGETSVTFPLWSLEERAHTVREGLAPLVVGRALDDARALDSLVMELERDFGRLKALWSPVGIQAAIGAFEMACVDALARAAGVPAWRWLAGPDAEPATAEMSLYAVGFGGDADTQAAAARAALDEGFAAVKVRAGFGLGRDAELLRTVRGAIGDGTLLIDANMAYERADAEQLAALADEVGAGWLEEPLPLGDLEGLARLRAAHDVRLAAGENVYGRADALGLVAAGAVDVVMPDLARCGGFGTARVFAAAARERGLPYSPHHYASDLGFAAALQLCAVEPGAESLLRDISPWPLRSAVLREAPVVDGGRARLPAGAGLGVAVDRDAIEDFKVL